MSDFVIRDRNNPNKFVVSAEFNGSVQVGANMYKNIRWEEFPDSVRVFGEAISLNEIAKAFPEAERININ